MANQASSARRLPKHDDVLEAAWRIPGATLGEVRVAAGVPRSVFASVVATLQAGGQLHIEADGLARRVLPPVPGIASCARQVVVLRREPARRLHGWLARQGPLSLRALVEHARQAWGWSGGVTREQVRKLAQAGLLLRRGAPVGEDQRQRWLEATEPKASARDLLP